MNPLTQHGLAHAIGWTLLHFCWQGAIVGVVLACLLRLLQRSAPQLRYLVACGALALTVAIPLATFTHLAMADYHLTHRRMVADDTALAVQAAAESIAQTVLARLADTLDPLVPGLLTLWMAGAALFTVRLSVGFRIAHRLRSANVSACSPQLRQRFMALQHRLGMSTPVALLVSSLVQVPMVIGWLRPVVLIPLECFTGLSELQIDAILSHELAHILRHDYLVAIVQSVVEAVLFYHPAVWWVSRQVRRERECCCDDLAVAIGGSALQYARALSTLEASRSSYPQAVLGANGGVLTMRITRLLHRNQSSPSSQAAAAVVLALLTVCAVALGHTARAETPAGRGIHPLQQAVPPPSAGQPVRIAAGVLAGQVLSKVAPVYPAKAKTARIAGAVILQAIISKTGDIQSLRVLSGPDELRISALDAVRQWKYKPYLLDGEPTEVDTTITVTYSLGDAVPPPATGPAAELAIRQIGGYVSAPALLSSAEANYSEEARAQKISGTVVVHLLVDTQGNATQVRVLRGLGHGLDEKAVQAVSTYKFRPALDHGQPVPVALNVEVNFRSF